MIDNTWFRSRTEFRTARNAGAGLVSRDLFRAAMMASAGLKNRNQFCTARNAGAGLVSRDLFRAAMMASAGLKDRDQFRTARNAGAGSAICKAAFVTVHTVSRISDDGGAGTASATILTLG